jgi:hypothetical protein
MANMWRYTFGMWKGADERKIVVLESFLRVVRAECYFWIGDVG